MRACYTVIGNPFILSLSAAHLFPALNHLAERGLGNVARANTRRCVVFLINRHPSWHLCRDRVTEISARTFSLNWIIAFRSSRCLFDTPVIPRFEWLFLFFILFYFFYSFCFLFSLPLDANWMANV